MRGGEEGIGELDAARGWGLVGCTSAGVGQERHGLRGNTSPATVLRIGADGKEFTLFETKDLLVQVVRIGPDGALYAATQPSGKVYKLNPGATAKQ